MTITNQRWFLAGVGSNLLRGGIAATQDAGVNIAIMAESNPIAPAGVGGEAMFGDLYLTVTHANPTLWAVAVTPIVDGVDQQPITLNIPAVVGDTVEEVFELSTMQAYLELAVEQSRYAPRGQWIQIRLSATQAPDGLVAFDGAEVAFEVLREGQAAANA